MRFKLAAVVAVVVVATGCSTAVDEPGVASSGSPAAAPSSAAPTATDLAPGLRRALSSRLRAAPPLRGERSYEPPEFRTGKAALAAGDTDYARLLNREGIEGVVTRRVEFPAAEAAGLRVVRVFRSAAGARKAVRHEVAGLRGHLRHIQRFPVPRVPGAVGAAVSVAGVVTGRNVFFAVGRFEYVLGAATRSSGKPGSAALARGAARWWRSVRALG